MISDELLSQAAEAYILALADSVPDREDYQHRFSPRFERKMRRVIRKGNHPVVYKAMRAAGCAALALVISFLMLMAVNPSARAAVMDWIREIYASYYFHSYYEQDANTEYLNIRYELGYVPQAHTLFDFRESQHNAAYSFSDQSGNMLFFTYSKSPASVEFFSDLNHDTIENVKIKDHRGLFLHSSQADTASILQWLDEDTHALLILSGFMEKEELIKIAENVKYCPD